MLSTARKHLIAIELEVALSENLESDEEEMLRLKTLWTRNFYKENSEDEGATLERRKELLAILPYSTIIISSALERTTKKHLQSSIPKTHSSSAMDFGDLPLGLSLRLSSLSISGRKKVM